MRRTFSIGLVCAILAIAMTQNASAFDGNRKGFILGFGIGESLTSWVEEGSWTSDRQNDIGFGTIFKIGGGVSENLTICYTNNVTWFSSGEVESVFHAQGITAIEGTYYYNPDMPSLYLSGLLGVAWWSTSIGLDPSGLWSRVVPTGIGLGAGIGYEFAHPIFSVDATLMYGMLTDVKLKVISILFTVNVLGY